MQKIPTLYVRDPGDRRHVIDEVNPGCEWVLAGEGTATRKWDGTCVKIDHAWYNGPQVGVMCRRQVKAGKDAPDWFVEDNVDPVTGHRMGWVPYIGSGFEKFIDEALGAVDGKFEGENPLADDWPEGSYELVGPKINGNPERRDRHELIRHGESLLDIDDVMGGRRDFEAFGDLMRHCAKLGIEGVVWWHPDGRRAKLKARDFGKPVPPT